MIRIGKCLSLAGLICILWAAGAAPLRAQSGVSVNATVSQTTVFTGERLRLNITVGGNFNNVSRPELPDFSDLQLLNSAPSTSRNISYVNGVTKASYTYSYFLTASSTGSYTIPAIPLQVDGSEFTTDPISITVVDRNASAQSGTASETPDTFLRLDISNRQPVTGQQLLADVVLYFKDGLEVRSYQPVPGWKAEGFWKEELDRNENPSVESTIMNGVRYRKASLLQFALFPTKAGALTIGPYEVRLSVRSAAQRDDPFSSFFGGFGSNQRQVELKTDPIKVQVQSLPDSTQNYIGAVGNFTIERRFPDSTLTEGQTLEITTRISGTGNVPLINKPQYQFPSGLEVYDPQESSDIKRSGTTISGTKTYTDVVIARRPGTFTIPETQLSYYSTQAGRYITQTLPGQTFTVKGGATTNSETGVSSRFTMAPITGLASWQPATAPPLTSYWWLWAGLALPAVALALGYWQKNYRHKMSTDQLFARSQKAADVADERLQQALQDAQNGNIKAAYNALQKALTGFIGDKQGLPEAGLSIEQYVAALEEQNIDTELVKNVRMLLNKCATINYAPNATADYLRSHVELARSIITKLKKKL